MVDLVIPGAVGRLPAYGSNAPTTGRIPMFYPTTGLLSYVTPDQIASGASAVDGPASATDNAIARFDGTTGKLIQNSAATIADTTGAIASGPITTTGAGGSVFNSTSLDADFTVKKLTSGNAVVYDAGADTLTVGTAITGTAFNGTGIVTTRTGTAAPASAGAVAAGPALSMFSNGISIWVTSDAPSFSATKGDLCINLAGSSSSTRLFINNGTTNWVAVTTAS